MGRPDALAAAAVVIAAAQTVPVAAEPDNPQGDGTGPCYRADYVDMANRTFVLEPLCELAPYLRHPVSGLTTRQMLDELTK